MNAVTTDRPDASTATDRESWLARMEEIGEDAGYFEPLGRNHWAFFVDDGPNLLVTFETLDTIRAASPRQMPLGYTYTAGNGWSHLCIIADGPTWYRDDRVYRYFDRLVDEGFLEDFDRVVFYGAGMGGYAACAYSVAAPGATVLALQPRATLDPAFAGWDRRDLAARKLDFGSRYGYAPDMIEGTGRVFLVFDPREREDAMHAALFRAPFVTELHTPHLGDRLDDALSHLGLLTDLLDAVTKGMLSRDYFAQLWRRRRNFGPYLKRLLAIADERGQKKRAAMICRSVTRRLNAPRFRRRLDELEAELGKTP
ncbi:phosphoadenosine phosphosulfate reductase [Aliigemmobacter aestuarii]|uniref:Phosphoadenosine phosphosulfate reductase n=1 Tax=Aliigemmobacter aestuarii TaxID=1445661 RepID=A0A4S3MSJ8_9RHOB|nr:phosphoadenosine phosphosulfate reductase [Gemmobacter aestuarii]THD84441.1 phosphoadenosine phosphosulfate reductase [Gemmobacter aestuarii]